jgi:glycosyltransferase involved in cell wall biosynthesis
MAGATEMTWGQLRHAVALLPAGDRFEDFFDKIGVTLETHRRNQTGGWLFNYVEALARADCGTVIVYMSARIPAAARFVHEPTGCQISVLPSPWLHRKLRAARWRYAPESRLLRSLEAYVATPPRALARELSELDCAAILCQEYESARFDVCVLLGRLTRRPVFGTYQGAQRGHSSVEAPLRRLALRWCGGLIIGSAMERQRIRDRYRLPEHMIAPIPNPLDVRRWRPEDRLKARRELRLPPDRRIVIWHGRVQIERKGLDLLLEAWRQVCATRPDRQPLLLLVGSGRDAEVLRHRVADLPAGVVQWVEEYVHDREQMWRLLSAADIATLPSRHEGFPVATLEAMACALPVVAADVSGVRDMLQAVPDTDTGIIVPPEDIGALADALGVLVDDVELSRKLGDSARSVAEQFSLEDVGRRLAQVLRRSTEDSLTPDKR